MFATDRPSDLLQAVVRVEGDPRRDLATALDRLVDVAESEALGARLAERKFGYVSEKDRLLLRHAHNAG
jgi:hypothetical protein